MSVKQVHNLIKQFADGCVFVSDFAEGDYDDIMKDGKNDFPLLFLNPVNSTMDGKLANHKVQIHLVDYCTNNKEENELRAVQKMHNVASILDAWLQSEGHPPQTYLVNTIYNFGRDRVHGVIIDFDLVFSRKCFIDISNVVV